MKIFKKTRLKYACEVSCAKKRERERDFQSGWLFGSSSQGRLVGFEGLEARCIKKERKIQHL